MRSEKVALALALAAIGGEWSCASTSNESSTTGSPSPSGSATGADGGTPADGSARDGSPRAGTDAGSPDSPPGQGSSDGAADAPSDGAADARSEGGTPVACVSNCTGKTCGDDGCGGTCGGCPPSQLCGPAQTCVASPSTTSIVVDAKSQGTPISSGIYGVAFDSDDSMQVAGLNRWGGDATELVQLEDRRLQRGRRLELRQLQGPVHVPVARTRRSRRARTSSSTTTSPSRPTR